MNWHELLRHPAGGDHIVQTWQDEAFLADAVAEYAASGLRAGEAVLLATTPHNRDLLQRRLETIAVQHGQLRYLDAEQALARFMQGEMPEWKSFHHLIGGQIAELGLRYPAVRVYGEMVDVLWRRGEQDAALRLEDFWNELARLQTFSLFCAYRLDPLDAAQYGPLECVCKAHTHFIPARDYERLDEAVAAASREVLDQTLAQMLLSLSANQRPATHMPPGQAALLWLHKNMPRTAEKVLSGVRDRVGPTA